jgi:hypothetical protein
MAEKEKLGIFVPTDNYIDHLIGVARAAKKAGKALCIFLTHKGVRISQHHRYQELAAIISSDEDDEISLCNVSWEELGLKDQSIPAGMGPKDLATQSRHCAMIDKCDRYMVL